MPKTWQFVSNHVEDGAGKNEETRKIVRKTAMKAFRRSQRLERAKDFMQKGPVEGDLRDSQIPEGQIGVGTSELPPEGVHGVETPGSSILRRDDDGESSVDLSSFLALLQLEGGDDDLNASPIVWPQEIAGFDPFGSSPLGTSRSWYFLFRHCK